MMPRKKIDFFTVDTGGYPIRFIVPDGQLIFVASDIARALGHPHDHAARTTGRWAGRPGCKLISLVPGKKAWRMITSEGVRHAIERSRVVSKYDKSSKEAWFYWVERECWKTVEKGLSGCEKDVNAIEDEVCSAVSQRELPPSEQTYRIVASDPFEGVDLSDFV